MLMNASEDLTWQSVCHLPSELRQEQIQRYSLDYIQQFQNVFQELFFENSINFSENISLQNLHLVEYNSLETMIPVIYHARVQAKIEKGSRTIGSQMIKLQNKNWQKNQTWKKFLNIYKNFVSDFILPQFSEYGGILYQEIPTLRVVFPGSVAPVKPHKDADYWHDSNEINFWVPLVPVSGANSLWSESEPGKGDFHSFEVDGSVGELMRFYGNRCQHYTTENTTPTCRVSFDFRVIPASLFRLNVTPPSSLLSSSTPPPPQQQDEEETKLESLLPPSSPSPSLSPLEGITTHSSYLDDESIKKLALRGAKPLLEGKYYQRMMIIS